MFSAPFVEGCLSKTNHLYTILSQFKIKYYYYYNAVWTVQNKSQASEKGAKNVSFALRFDKAKSSLEHDNSYQYECKNNL